eukprot:3938796-Rhodomonas_salina.4
MAVPGWDCGVSGIKVRGEGRWGSIPRTCFALSGTDLCYAATRPAPRGSSWAWAGGYMPTRPCPVLTEPTGLPHRH